MRTRALVLRRRGVARDYAACDALAVEEVELADPGPGQVLMRVAAAGVCHSDLSVVDGSRPRPLPMVLGHEAAGVVEAAGPGVDGVMVGDHVVASYVPSCGKCDRCSAGKPVLCLPGQAANRVGSLLGGSQPFSSDGEEIHHQLGVSAFAERTVVAAESVISIPDDIPLDVAAVFGCAVLTGVGAVVNTAGVRPGDSVAVFGLGGVGLAAVMGAVLAGSGAVVAVDLVAAKLELAKSLGATHAVDASAGDAVGAVVEMTGGGVDWAFETAGSARALVDCYSATATGGTTVAVGLPHPDQEFAIPAVSLVGQEKTVKGSYMGSAVPRRDVPRFLALYRAGRLPVDRLITRTGVALDGVGDAFDRLAAGSEVRQIVQPA